MKISPGIIQHSKLHWKKTIKSNSGIKTISDMRNPTTLKFCLWPLETIWHQKLNRESESKKSVFLGHPNEDLSKYDATFKTGEKHTGEKSVKSNSGRQY